MTDAPDLVGEMVADWAAAREAAGEGSAAASTSPPRSVRDGGVVELREVTKGSVRAICRLGVAPAQRSFVAPNAVSLAEALFEEKAWYRAVVGDDVPVGFVMLFQDTDAPEYYLWRLMVDARFQGQGFGRRALELVVEHVRSLPGATALLTSWVPGDGSPEPFYLGLGFVPTGEIDEGEIVARLAL
jgi:diamine N-acetyltransferase